MNCTARAVFCVLVGLFTLNFALHAATIWVEGEATAENTMVRHPWWYDKVKKDELSGGEFISNWSDKVQGTAKYAFNIEKAGKYRFWLRANPVATVLSYRLNGGEWQKIDCSSPLDNRNIAADGKPDLRFIAWIDVGEKELKAGQATLEFRCESQNNNHGAIDCFTFTDEYFAAKGTVHPGGPKPTTITETGTWPFEPDPDRYSPDALLDLRGLNEKFAGEHGFIELSKDGRDFACADGQPIRFWAVNSTVYTKGPKALEDHARFLAKRGVNMVRWHGHIVKNDGKDLKEIDEKAREELWQYVAAMKKEGVYLTLSPYYPHATPLNKNWGLESPQENMTGLVYFDPKVQEAYKHWLRQIFEPKNPYTGVALKDEPAVAIIQIQNEDSLLFWTFSAIKGKELELLQRRFGEWAAKKHGSLDNALKAWNTEKVDGDNSAESRLGLRHIWDLTSDGIKQKGKPSPRLADQAQFMTELMRDWHGEVSRFLRKDIGARQLVNAGNWRTADPVRLNDLERYAYTTTEVAGMNRYTGCLHTGQHAGWAIVNGDKFDKSSRLTNPADIPVNIKQVAGHPFIIPESSWVPPTLYDSEGPFLVSAYSSLNGVDGFYWFSFAEPQWRQPASANGYLPSIGKWVANTPELLGTFPAAALLFRKNYLKRGETVVHEERSLDDMWHLRVPVVSEEGAFDPNRDQGDYAPQSTVKQEVDRLAYLVGPVEVVYGGDPAKTSVLKNLNQLLDTKAKLARSVTGELTLDYDQGLCTMNAPKAQGVSGFLSKVGTFKLADVTVQSKNDYATVLVVALDDQPLAASKKILVQVGTVARPMGWAERPATWTEGGKTQTGFEIVSYGKAPWAVADADVSLTVKNARLTKATALDMNGLLAGSVELKREGGNATFTMPKNRMYVVLE